MGITWALPPPSMETISCSQGHASAHGLTFPLACRWAGPVASSRLARLARPCLRPSRRWHGDSGQVCKLVPLSPGQGEPWRLANMTQENVC